jgi:5'-nucleotidase
MESNLFEGAPVIRFYNALGVDAAAVGNQEFDYGPEGTDKSVPVDPGDDPQGALKARAAEARFPFLAANIVDDAGASPDWLKRARLIERDGVRIGIVGAATVLTPETTVRANLRGLHFLDPVEPVRSVAERLRREGKADVVILTAHSGGGCKDNSDPDDLSSCEDGELFKILRALPRGLIDVAIGGHTHKGIAKRVNGTLVLQAYSRGKSVGWATVPVGEPDEEPRIGGLANVQLPSRFLGKEIQPDEGIEKLLAPEIERVRSIKQTPLGASTEAAIPGAYGGESPLGNLVTDILRSAIPGAEIGLTNGGGLRAPLPAGPLNYGHVFEVMPFDNRLAKITTDGATVRRMVELGRSGRHGNLSWSGLAFAARDCEVGAIEAAGEPLVPMRIYHVVTNDYLAAGGSGFDHVGLKPEQVEILWNGPFLLRDVVARTISKRGGELKPGDYFDPENPRQRVTGECSPKSPSAAQPAN